ncbi:cell filamentation protein Fic [Alkalispirochaeta odontotermitis]|nr:cell filamentation protein Fic [Alkalispirochaeta odontotermitis]CAB1070660.1 Filamentation induced by cAMP protein Fic [Olavius algarvensis Delta 1 endosymbiont]
MAEYKQDKPIQKPAGYTALIERYDLDVISNWHKSLVTARGIHRVNAKAGVIEEVYPSKYWPGDTLGDHLEFALKYDGTNLAILSILFQKIVQKDLLIHVQSKPTGKYARRLWFLYEFLTGKMLALEDLKHGNYIDLLEPDEYYTVTPVRQVRRQRINDNLLGDSRFCPTVRRIDNLREFESADLPGQCRQVVAGYSPELLKRALGYLYSKETKSSFEIEHIKPTSTRTERFVAMLQPAEQEDFCRKQQLIEVQNRIVDARFRDSDYRSSQNYVGETVAWQKERIHFACPKPEDLADLMGGLIAAHERMDTGGVSAVIQAAVIAYGFVFLQPFEDGNGRIHRFLIHNILARRGFTPKGVMFPISAAMLKNRADYDASLEAFSRQLMPLVEYFLDEYGNMTVHNETAIWYRFIDMTPQAVALFRFIDQTIDTELASELAFIANYDKTKKVIQKIVDMPDRQIDLFIRFCLQNNSRISARKRMRHFDFLSDEEVALLEQAVQSAYGAATLKDA